VKTAQEDEWLHKQLSSVSRGTLAVGLRRDPTYNRLCNYINNAVDQLDAVNPAMEHPDVLAVLNGDDHAGFTDLIQALTGNAYCDSGQVIPMFRECSEGRILKPKLRVHLYLWLNEWQPDHAPWKFFPEVHTEYRAALCRHLNVNPTELGRCQRLRSDDGFHCAQINHDRCKLYNDRRYMATKKAAKAAKESAPSKPSRTRKERKFPALTFEEALKLGQAIQDHGAGQKVRRLTLFEKLDQSPDGEKTRRLITASGQYGITKGAYNAEFLELTQDGATATSDESTAPSRLQARFDLAIKSQEPFDFLYNKLKNGKMPAKEIMADYLTEANIDDSAKAECIDTFTLNMKFLGMLRTIAGSERIVSIEQGLEEAPAANPPSVQDRSAEITSTSPAAKAGTASLITAVFGDLAKTCFYITPIGEPTSEERQHADFMLEYVIKPAVEEFGLNVVRADQMGKPGMIGKQIIEQILKARLVIADLSFHNPNVFYELCLRHTTRLPTVQIKREIDKIPFDLNCFGSA